MVADWAGHSLNVLLQVYAKCIVGREELNRRRIQAMLDEEDSEPPEVDP